MELSLGSAIVSGLMATASVLVALYLLDLVYSGLDLPWIIGKWVMGGGRSALVYVVGFALVYLAGALLALVYAWLFELLGIRPVWLWGAVVGLLHGAAVAALLLRGGKRTESVPASDEPRKVPAPIERAAQLTLAHVAFGALFAFLYGPY